jgi:capsule polysaccharide export protein KpsE/RkpR
VGIGGVAYGVDQKNKREQERENFRSQLDRLEKDLSAKESELAQLRSRLGEKNDQVRTLAAEIERLRQNIASMRKAA